MDPAFQTQLVQRHRPGIWRGLYEFPLIESIGQVEDKDILGLIRKKGFEDLSNPDDVIRFNPKPLIHKLSHQHLHVTFWILRLSHPLKECIPISEMQDYPVPVLIANFMETVKNSYF